MAIFGTDGIRGVAYKDLNTTLLYNLGKVLGKNKKILIGRDTRPSGEEFLNAFVLGVISVNGEVFDLKVVPTPCVSYLTKKLNFDFGVMITASHNPYYYNGIKIFDRTGNKISKELEEKIESKLACKRNSIIVLGKNKNYSQKRSIYRDFIVDSTADLSGLKILLDCCNGANYIIAGSVFKKLGADIKLINNKNDGEKINNNCGALYIENLKNIKGDFDLKIAFDGDADRVMAVDRLGRVIDGDRILLMLAKIFKSENKLKGNKVVTTKMSNLKLEEELKKENITLIRTDVGDKYVSKIMSLENLNLGAEQSGHVIIGDFLPTGDGLLASLKLCEALKYHTDIFNEVMELKFYPQMLDNIQVKDKSILNKEEFLKVIKLAEKMLNNKGRILVRASGTEPKIRILIETEDQKLAKKIMSDVKDFITKFER